MSSSVPAIRDDINDQLHAQVDRWSAKIVTRPTPRPAAVIEQGGQVVVLTGVTGAVGAHVLYQLSRRSDVARIICLSRAKSHDDSLLRIYTSLDERGRDKVDAGKIVSYAADVNKPRLGLSPKEYAYIRDSATSLVHIAWPVNFNWPLARFDEHIGGAVNLINMTLESPRAVPPAFFFTSSISTIVGFGNDRVVSEEYLEASGVVLGYGQGKWIVEQVMKRASSVGRFGVMRIGQMCGDTENGIWGEADSWPLMFRSAVTCGALPMVDEKPDWMPLDIGAQVMTEIISATHTDLDLQAPHAEMYNVMNPHLGTWDKILCGLREGGLSFETVNYAEWLCRLARSNPDRRVNPTHKLLDFFKAGLMYTRPTQYSFDKVARLSPAFAKCRPIDSELMTLFTKHWIRSWCLTPTRLPQARL